MGRWAGGWVGGWVGNGHVETNLSTISQRETTRFVSFVNTKYIFTWKNQE